MKYYRMVNGVPVNPIEMGGSTAIAMADTTSDGQEQYLLASPLVDKISDKTVTDAILLLSSTKETVK